MEIGRPDGQEDDPRPAARGAPIDWPAWLIGLFLLLGMLARVALLPHLDGDAHTYLTPWFNYAAAHGWRALGTAFTNYTPFYSYLLIASTPLRAVLPPMTIVKGISYVFELANAGLLLALVRAAGGRPWQAALAFGLAWVAPMVIFNGAAWGQADSIWACFDLLAVLMCLRGRDGAIPFGVSFAVKAQGVFLGPFILAMALRGRRLLWLIVAVPAVYLLLAAPVLIFGRPLNEVLLVYVEQGQTFHRLSMNAGSLWAFFGNRMDYGTGVLIGMALAALMGTVITVLVWRSRRSDPLFLMAAAAASLMLMPYLLPKMHDRYFYGFEILSIALACLRWRYVAPAIVAQISGVLAYLAYESGYRGGIVPAAVLNGVIGMFLLGDLVRMSGLTALKPYAEPEAAPR
jgi:Gpi18-like mannosyltransferase